MGQYFVDVDRQLVSFEAQGPVRVRELKTTFASHYTDALTLSEAMKPKSIAAYAKRSTRSKFSLSPNPGSRDSS